MFIFSQDRHDNLRVRPQPGTRIPLRRSSPVTLPLHPTSHPVTPSCPTQNQCNNGDSLPAGPTLLPPSELLWCCISTGGKPLPPMLDIPMIVQPVLEDSGLSHDSDNCTSTILAMAIQKKKHFLQGKCLKYCNMH